MICGPVNSHCQYRPCSGTASLSQCSSMLMGLPTRAKPRAVSRNIGLIEKVDGQKRLMRAARMILPARTFTDGLRASIGARSALTQPNNLLQLSDLTDRQAMIDRSTWLTHGKRFLRNAGHVIIRQIQDSIAEATEVSSASELEAGWVIISYSAFKML